MWLSDAGLAGSPEYRQRYREWLDYFAELNIEAVGMGWIVLAAQRPGRAGHPHRGLALLGRAADRPGVRRGVQGGRPRPELDADLLAHDWRLAEDVVEETRGSPGAADPRTIVLRQQRGFRRALQADTALAAVLGACRRSRSAHHRRHCRRHPGYRPTALTELCCRSSAAASGMASWADPAVADAVSKMRDSRCT